MLNEFIDFTTSLFPSISPYTQQRTKEAIRQFNELEIPYRFIMNQSLEHIAQGDIIDNIPFILYDEDGSELSNSFKAIILSNSCDATRDDNLMLAPFFPINKLKADENAIRKNTIYPLLHFPDGEVNNEAADMSLIRPYPRSFIEDGLEKGRFKKVASLNSYGYYLFLIKLTIHFMRPEDGEVQENRKEDRS